MYKKRLVQNKIKNEEEQKGIHIFIAINSQYLKNNVKQNKCKKYKYLLNLYNFAKRKKKLNKNISNDILFLLQIQ